MLEQQIKAIKPIRTKCYGHEDEWDTRAKAIDYFRECAMCSEGAERERYTNIILQLLDGANYATDED